jgi:hypothetical protein
MKRIRAMRIIKILLAGSAILVLALLDVEVMAQKPTVGVCYSDVTSAAGIAFRHVNGRSGEFYYPETMGGGACFFDYDGDGYIDLYIVNGGPLGDVLVQGMAGNMLYRNNGDGTFGDVTEEAGVGEPSSYGQGCGAADYDNDGDLDLYVTNFGRDVLYRNNGDGTFTDVTGDAGVGDERWGQTCVFTDYDNDGDLDLYVQNYLDYTLARNKRCGPTIGGRRRRDYCSPDIYRGVPDVLYRNEGDGTFTDVTRASGLFNPLGKGMGIVFGDYDSDGDADLFVSNDGMANFFYRNNGNGTFSDVSLISMASYDEHGMSEGSMGADFADLDNDGDLDLFVPCLEYEGHTLYRNEGGKFFDDVSQTSGLHRATTFHTGYSPSVFDYDNDGDLDIFVSCGRVRVPHELRFDEGASYHERYGQSDLLLSNDGSGRFSDVSQVSGPYFNRKDIGRGAIHGDVDNDGDLDLFIVNLDGRAVLLRNDGGNGNRWITLKLVGTRSNRDGVGAKVKVISGASTQIREVRVGGGYVSQNDMRVHFGLGDRDRIDRIEIRWPSGVVQTLEDVAANQIMTVTEPSE